MTETREPDPGAQPPVTLPEPVRARALALAAEALGRMPAEHVPAALKKVARFAPTRRVRLAGNLIAGALETDEEFRDHLAVQVRVLVGGIGQALDEGRTPAAADPVEVAATAYLLRPDGWRDLVAASAVTTAEPQRRTTGQDERVQRLERQVETLQEEARTAKARTKEQADQLKADNADLRRKLGEARKRARTAEEAAEEATRRRDEAAAAGERSVADLEAEVRRLRTRVAELETALGTARRSDRIQRTEGSNRARLLLDTLVDAAQGLRRELGLPAVDRLPADGVQAHLAEEGTRTSSGRASLPVDDPALLEELLTLPRAHLVVDGYNVTKNAMPELPLDKQRERLLSGMAHLKARTQAEITVVFDAAETENRPLVAAPRGVRVLFSPFGVIADDVIRELVAAEPSGRAVVVASSDQAVVRDVVAAGFRVVAATALARLALRP